MASIANDANGRKRIQFMGLDGKRRTLRLGKASKSVAARIAGHVENIVTAELRRQPIERDTAAWLGDLPETFYGKLVAVGLVSQRNVERADGLGKFLDDYLAKRTDLKGGTRVFISHTIRNLKAFFGADTPLASITTGDADDFGRYLVKEKLSPATVNRRLGLAKSLFRVAVRHKLIVENPFMDAKTANKTNPERQRFIDRETITKIIDAAPSAEWRMLIALARFGGVRVPSEAVTLKWEDIDFVEGRITVYSPKTEHHAGKGTRQIPLFPELLLYLEDLRELAEVGAVYVFTKLRRDAAQHATGWKAVNLRSQFTKIIKRAGLTPWPRLWVNLRSSCETELVQRFPAHVTAAWLGHTPDIAQKHYLQVLPSHFQDAASENAAQKATQTASELRRIDAHGAPANEKTPCFQGVSALGVGDTGFEPVTSTV